MTKETKMRSIQGDHDVALAEPMSSMTMHSWFVGQIIASGKVEFGLGGSMPDWVEHAADAMVLVDLNKRMSGEIALDRNGQRLGSDRARRDDLAKHAMVGILAGRPIDGYTPKMTAEDAYHTADQMIKGGSY